MLHNVGYQTAGYKPVASGSEWLPEGLRSDALTLQQFSSVLGLSAIESPIGFETPHHLIL